jgi:hypothetical protein
MHRGKDMNHINNYKDKLIEILNEGVKQENLFKLWFLIEEGITMSSNMMREIKNNFLQGRRLKSECWVETAENEEPRTLLQWKKLQQKYHDGTYKHLYVWNKIDKNFKEINELDSNFRAGKNFILYPYVDDESQVVKKFNKNVAKSEMQIGNSDDDIEHQI